MVNHGSIYVCMKYIFLKSREYTFCILGKTTKPNKIKIGQNKSYGENGEIYLVFFFRWFPLLVTSFSERVNTIIQKMYPPFAVIDIILKFTMLNFY